MLARKNNVSSRGKQCTPRIRLLGRKSGLFGGRIVPEAAVAVDIINVLVTVTSVLDIRLPNKWVRSAKGGRPGRSPPCGTRMPPPGGCNQNVSINGRSVSAGCCGNRGGGGGSMWWQGGGEGRRVSLRDYSDNQRALNLGPKRAETPSALCRRSGFKAVSHERGGGGRFKVDARVAILSRDLVTTHEIFTAIARSVAAQVIFRRAS